MSAVDDCVDLNAVDFSYPFLSGIDPANPPSRITIPQKFLDAMANMERQYWEIKAKRYNVVVFFKKGKFYELYDYDAVIANKEFGLKMVFDTTNRGKMRLAGVPEQSLSEWARLFVFRGYKVGRVEQMVKGAEDDSPGGSKVKIVPRELVEVLTPGTLTDAAMLSDHNEVFLLAFAPQPEHCVVDAFAVDLSRHVVFWCPCGDVAAVERYREWRAAAKEPAQAEHPVSSTWTEAAMRSVTALLQQLHPREVVVSSVSSTSKSDVLYGDYLAKWIQSDGFAVEHVVVPRTASSAAATPGASHHNPSARETISAYLSSLKLERELPLLDTAVLYHAHIFSSSSSATQTLPGGGEVQQPRATTANAMKLLEWERRFGEGLVLDSATVSNLEVVANLLDSSEKNSLHSCLNRCITNGGKRLFRAWLLRPSASVRVIEGRQRAVKFLMSCGLAGHSELWGRVDSDASSSSGAGQANACLNDSMSVGSASQSLTPLSASVAGGLKRTRDGDDNDSNSDDNRRGAFRSSQASSASSRSSGNAHFLARFANMLSVDFERSLSRLAEIKNDGQHQTISYVDPLVKYHKNLGIILSSVQAFSEMVEWATQFHAMCRRRLSQQQCISGSLGDTATPSSTPSSAESVIPPLLEELLFAVEAAAESVSAMEKLFDRRVAAETGLLTPARGTSATYDAAVERLAVIEAKLNAYKKKAQQDVFGGAPVSFVDVGKDLFLLEVAPSDAPRMTPAGMVERARSGKSVKYVVDALGSLVEAHKEATAEKSGALLTVLQSVAGKICEHCPSLYGATSALSYLDCLINLARLTIRFPNMTFPQLVGSLAASASASDGNGNGNAVENGEAFLEAEELVHPLLAKANREGGSAPVPNTVSLDDNAGRLLMLTGPNMAGKSTLMRTVAVNVIMSQLGGPVLAARMRLSPVTRIFTRIGARDATQKGHSTLYVELSETAEILRNADSRSLCLIDELGRGTSTHDGLAIAHATLQALKHATPTPPLTIFSTHYHSLALEQVRCKTLSDRHVQLGYMDFALTGGARNGSENEPLFKDDDGDDNDAWQAALVPKITFLYRLVSGVCDRSYGVEVALMAGVRPALVEIARDKSAELATLTALHEDLETVAAFLQQRTG